jgi:hypothetical protein
MYKEKSGNPGEEKEKLQICANTEKGSQTIEILVVMYTH